MHFYPSIELDEVLKIKIGHLEGKIDPLPFSEIVRDPTLALSFRGSPQPVSLVVEAQVYAQGNPISVPVFTSYKPPSSRKLAKLKTYQWNEWLELPVRLCDLPSDSQVFLTVKGPSGKSELSVYCGAILNLFGNDQSLTQGRQKLNVALDTNPQKEISTRSIEKAGATKDGNKNPNANTGINKLEKLLQQQQMGQIPNVGWLDALVYRKIESLAAAEGEQHALFVELPLWDHDVVWVDKRYLNTRPSVFSATQQLPSTISLLKQTNDDEGDHLMAVYDPDFARETPIEAKYRRLVRLSTNDREMRPNAKVRDELERIVSKSPAQELTSDDKILLWRYRYYLTKRKQALTKFVKSVSWDDEAESGQAVEVLHLWVDIDVADALELLGPEVRNAQVRAYAVDRLRTATDHDLELFLLQLVEALKFEPWVGSSTKSYLARFLENRAVLNPNLGNFFYWYVSVQATDPTYGANTYQPVLRHYLAALPRKNPHVSHNSNQIGGGSSVAGSNFARSTATPSRKTSAGSLAPVTSEPSSSGGQGGSAQGVAPATLKQIESQVIFVNKLLELAKFVKQSKEPRPRKIQQMREYIADPRNELIKFPPTKLPLDPSVVVVGCIPEHCTVFKSSMLPLKIDLKTMEGTTYALIFKSGDDLRQDQLIMQIIQLMDQLLRNENLDLKLTPYRILATSRTDGAIQFIPNEPLAHIISQHHGILPFFRKHAADPDAPLGVESEVMDNFVRSCAGYAVITYLLGVGDRHLDNLLMDYQGHFFHIDFGYILGKDPKPFPPMIKLPIQLIDGMGGINSPNYTRFRSYCFTAFTTLRKSANLILALFNLMTESTIPNIMTERDQAVHKVEERFCLQMSEEEAILHFQNLINDSVNAFLPMVIDRLHSMAQYWRA